MPRPADTTHGSGGRPTSKAAATVDPGLNLNPTLADLKNADPDCPVGTASDYAGTTTAARGRRRNRNGLTDPTP